MVKSTARNDRSLGYTLVEMLVTLTVISLFAVMVFYSLGKFRNDEPVALAQAQLISDLRTVQNRVNNGGNQDPFEMVVFDPGAQDRYYIYTGYSTYSTNLGGLNTNSIQTRYMPKGSYVVPWTTPPDMTETGYLCIVSPNFLNSHPAGFDSKWFYCGGQPNSTTGAAPPALTLCPTAGLTGLFIWCQGAGKGLGVPPLYSFSALSIGICSVSPCTTTSPQNLPTKFVKIESDGGIFVTNIYAQ